MYLLLLIGLVKQPDEWVEWFIAWGRFRARAWWCFLIVRLTSSRAIWDSDL